jgi:hypothetical protein
LAAENGAMHMLRSPPLIAQAWLDDVFAAKAVGKGGIVRRAIRDVEREMGRESLSAKFAAVVFTSSNAVVSSS